MCSSGRREGGEGIAVCETKRLLEALTDMLLVPETKATLVRKVGCCLRLLVGEESGLVMDLRDSAGAPNAVREGDTKAEVVDAILHLSDADFALVCAGELAPERAFMTGRLAVRGNLLRAMKCEPIFELLRPPPTGPLVVSPPISKFRPPPKAVTSDSVVPTARL